jgi:hypothetical protein
MLLNRSVGDGEVEQPAAMMRASRKILGFSGDSVKSVVCEEAKRKK